MDNFWLILLIFGAISIFSRKNEKQSHAPEADAEGGNQGEHIPTEWERRIRELLGEENSSNVPQSTPSTATQPINSSKRVHTPATIKRKEVNNTSQLAQNRATTGKSAMTQTTINRQKTHSTIPDKIKEGEIGSKGEIETILEDFSMEKAVIYSEILKPKYEEL